VGCTSGEGEVARKGDRTVNMVQKMCTRACKCKMIYIELLQESQEGEKGERQRD
jgi:hypothetical protein